MNWIGLNWIRFDLIELYFFFSISDAASSYITCLMKVADDIGTRDESEAKKIESKMKNKRFC